MSQDNTVVIHYSPFFSVIIPSYNRGHIIQRAIHSVVHQSFRDIEIIIVDDGSTDNTLEVVNNIKDPRIKIISQENAGVSAARNNGAKIAIANYLIFLDSDDELCAGALEAVLANVSNEYQCFCFSTFFVSQGEQTKISPRKLGPLHNYKTGLFLAGAFIIKRDFFLKIGQYDPKIFYGENDELGQRICKEGNIFSADIPVLISHRERQVEKNKKYRREIIAKTLEHYLHKYEKDLRERSPRDLVIAKHRLAVCYFVMSRDKEAQSILKSTLKEFKQFKTLRLLVRMSLLPNTYRKFLSSRGMVE